MQFQNHDNFINPDLYFVGLDRKTVIGWVFKDSSLSESKYYGFIKNEEILLLIQEEVDDKWISHEFFIVEGERVNYNYYYQRFVKGDLDSDCDFCRKSAIDFDYDILKRARGDSNLKVPETDELLTDPAE